MNRDKLFFRHALLYYFDLQKSVSETCRLLQERYGKQAPSHTTCKEWFQRFRSGDTDVNDKEHSGQPKKFKYTELQALLNENSAQMQMKSCWQKKKSFLWRIVTGDKTWVDPGQPSTSIPKQNIRRQKVLLCIWWNQHDVLYFELLRKSNETVTVKEVYKHAN